VEPSNRSARMNGLNHKFDTQIKDFQTFLQGKDEFFLLISGHKKM
jgi:hypothetical protein